MINIEISKEILNSFAGTSLALLSAGLAWLLKSTLDKHKSEIVALAKYERCLAINLEILYDNFNFLDQWIDSIKINNRPFSVHFEKYLINDNEHYKISDLKLISKVIFLNYKLRRSAADFDHLQKSYFKSFSEIDAIPNKTSRMHNLITFHRSFVPGLERIKVNRNHLENEILKSIARIHVDLKVRRHSLFGCLSFLFKDILPRTTQKQCDSEYARLCKEVEERRKTHKA